MTNGDKIRSMSNEKLAEILFDADYGEAAWLESESET